MEGNICNPCNGCEYHQDGEFIAHGAYSLLSQTLGDCDNCPYYNELIQCDRICSFVPQSK